MEESRQIAFITWRDGMEQMIIKTDTKTAEHGEGTYVWIFPVPADPEDVVVYHIRKVEYYGGGKNLYTAAKEAVEERMNTIFTLSQIWPIIPKMFTKGGYLSAAKSVRELSAITTALGKTEAPKDYGVTVHETIAEHGLTSEVITAREADGLRRYIQDKYGVDLPEEIEDVFADYIGKKFTFIVSESNGMPKAMAVMVEFPTEKPYFPLKPTSVHGSKAIPITVYVDGLWEPNTWKEIKPRIKVEHRIEGSPPKVSGDEKFWGSFKEFTIISLTAPSKYLKDDFYLKRATTAQFAALMYRYSYLFGVIFIIAIFGLSGLVVWTIMSRKKEELAKYVVAGASSILTPIATIVALKKAEISGRYCLPAFKKWWQNVLYYAALLYTTLALLTSVGTIILFTLMLLMEYGTSEPAFIVLAFFLSMLGGAAFIVAIGAVPLWLMHKKWRHEVTGIPVPHLLLILLLNAVLYWIFTAWVFA